MKKVTQIILEALAIFGLGFVLAWGIQEHNIIDRLKEVEDKYNLDGDIKGFQDGYRHGVVEEEQDALDDCRKLRNVDCEWLEARAFGISSGE